MISAAMMKAGANCVVLRSGTEVAVRTELWKYT